MSGNGRVGLLCVLDLALLHSCLIPGAGRGNSWAIVQVPDQSQSWCRARGVESLPCPSALGDSSAVRTTHSARATGEDTPCPTRASHSNCSYPTVTATSCICALPKAPAPSMAVSGCGFPQMTTLQLPTQAGSSIHSPHLIVATQRALILLLGTAQRHRATVHCSVQLL